MNNPRQYRFGTPTTVYHSSTSCTLWPGFKIQRDAVWGNILFNKNDMHSAIRKVPLQRIKLCGHRLLRPEYVFFLVFIVCATLIAISIPVGGGFDEPTHVARVDQLSRGEILPQEIGPQPAMNTRPPHNSTLYGGSIDSGLVQVTVNNMQQFQLGKEKYPFPSWEAPSAQGHRRWSGVTTEFAFSNTAINSPVAYAPQIIGSRIAKLFSTNITINVLAMRLAGILFFALSLFFCIRVIPVGKWVLTTVSLIPGVLCTNSTVTADLMTYVVPTAFLTSLLVALHSSKAISTCNWIFLGITTISLGLVKISVLPMLALLVLIPLIKPQCRSRKDLSILVSFAVVSIIIFLLWYAQINHVNTGAMWSSGADPDLQKAFILQHPGSFAKALFHQFFSQNYFLIGYLGVLNAHGTIGFSSWFTIVALMCAMVLKDTREQPGRILVKHYRLIAAGFFTASLLIFLLTEIALYLQFSAVGSPIITGVQSRYFLPIVNLFVIPLLLMFGHNSVNSEDTQPLESDSVDYKKSLIAIPQRGTIFMVAIQLFSAAVLIIELFYSVYGLRPIVNNI